MVTIPKALMMNSYFNLKRVYLTNSNIVVPHAHLFLFIEGFEQQEN